MDAYASFGGSPTYSDDYINIQQLMYEKGKQWALKGNKKLPVAIEVPNQLFPFPIVRSSHPWASEFVKGFKDGKNEN